MYGRESSGRASPAEARPTIAWYTEINKEETSGRVVRLEQLMERDSTFEGEEHRGTDHVCCCSRCDVGICAAMPPPLCMGVRMDDVDMALGM